MALGYDRTFAQVAARRPEDTDGRPRHGPPRAGGPSAGTRPCGRCVFPPVRRSTSAPRPRPWPRTGGPRGGRGGGLRSPGQPRRRRVGGGRTTVRRLAGRDRRRPRGPGRRSPGRDHRRPHSRHAPDTRSSRSATAVSLRPVRPCGPGSAAAGPSIIVDPATGDVPPPVWRTVSVSAGSCVDANTATTAALVLGECAPDWLRGTGPPARLVRTDGSGSTWEAGPPTEAPDERRRPARGGRLGSEPALVRHQGRRHRLTGPADRDGRARHRGGGTVRAGAPGPVRGVGAAPQPVAAHPGVPGDAHRHRHRRQLRPPHLADGLRAVRGLVPSAVGGPGRGGPGPSAGGLGDQRGPRAPGPRRWKAVHWLAYASWPVALFHAVGTGTDTRLGPQLRSTRAVC